MSGFSTWEDFKELVRNPEGVMQSNQRQQLKRRLIGSLRRGLKVLLGLVLVYVLSRAFIRAPVLTPLPWYVDRFADQGREFCLEQLARKPDDCGYVYTLPHPSEPDHSWAEFMCDHRGRFFPQPSLFPRLETPVVKVRERFSMCEINPDIHDEALYCPRVRSGEVTVRYRVFDLNQHTSHWASLVSEHEDDAICWQHLMEIAKATPWGCGALVHSGDCGWLSRSESVEASSVS